mmetsp:Transcript_44897/g.106555  ORF Transcript_44897/g.106555 Transcript_44897/m.106555 type:complete len:364 (-) Transcript_44897:50-1141(-)
MATSILPVSGGRMPAAPQASLLFGLGHASPRELDLTKPVSPTMQISVQIHLASGQSLKVLVPSGKLLWDIKYELALLAGVRLGWVDLRPWNNSEAGGSRHGEGVTAMAVRAGPGLNVHPAFSKSEWYRAVQEYEEKRNGELNLMRAVKNPDPEVAKVYYRRGLVPPPPVSSQVWMAYNIASYAEALESCVQDPDFVCSRRSFPCMRAGNYRFEWRVPAELKASHPDPCMTLAAVDFIDAVFMLLHESFEDTVAKLSDESTAEEARQHLRTLLRLLFRVAAHLYCHHMPESPMQEVHRRIHWLFKGLICFLYVNRLASEKDIAPVRVAADSIVRENLETARPLWGPPDEPQASHEERRASYTAF